MEDIVELLVLTHIGVAIVTVITGTISVISKKSKYMHKTFGKMYLLSMILTAGSAYIVMSFPGHADSIMALIGLFNLYFAISGYRSLQFKTVFSPDKVKLLDKILSGTMFLTASMMLVHGVYSIINSDTWGYVLIIFSLFGYVTSVLDFKFYRAVQMGGYTWMEFHAAKMIGSFIGSITAVFVTQLSEYLGIIAWFIPTVFGLMYMAYWIKKIRTKPEIIFDW